jgi:hypothetical protein
LRQEFIDLAADPSEWLLQRFTQVSPRVGPVADAPEARQRVHL